jgi:hypothetical protein
MMKTNSNKQRMTADEYQDHMDALATKVGLSLEGEMMEEAIVACAANIGFGVAQLPPEGRRVMLNHVLELINQIINKVDDRQKKQ